AHGLPPSALLWGAASIIPIAILGVGSSLMRTAKRIFASQFYDQVLRPVLLVLLLGGAAASGLSLQTSTALMFTALAAAVAVCAVLVHLLRVLAPSIRAPADYSIWREWFAVSIPLLMVGAMQELLNQLEIVMLGLLTDARQAGLFSAALRLAILPPFVLTALYAVSGPLVASAYHRRDTTELQRIASLC